MRKITIIIMILTFFLNLKISAQEKKYQKEDLSNYKVHIFPDSFLVGTFSDYLTRFYLIDKETQIDNYSLKEKSIAKYVSYFIKRYYKIENELNHKEDQTFELYIPSLAKRLNNTFYNENGYLITEKFKSEEEKLSFLLGVYYRNGELIKNHIYEIKLVNSPKEQVILKLLQDLGCSQILYKSNWKENTKTDLFYFVATPKMEKYFQTLNQEKSQFEFEKIDINETKNDKIKEKQNREFVKYLEKILIE